jgi:hypothetical protein
MQTHIGANRRVHTSEEVPELVCQTLLEPEMRNVYMISDLDLELDVNLCHHLPAVGLKVN